MAAHRYWRLHISQTGGGWSVFVNEIILATTPSGPQAAIGGTASASSYDVGSVASKAFDGIMSSTNFWRSSTSAMYGGYGNEHIQYDMGAGNAIDVAEMRLHFSVTSLYVNSYPAAFALLHSDDGDNWVLRRAWSNQVFANGETKTLDATPLPNDQIFNRVVLRRDYRHNSGAVVGILQSVSNAALNPRHLVSVPWAGKYFVAGSATLDSNPFPCRVDLVDQRSGNLVRQGFTKKDGKFRFEHIGPGPWTVVGVDNSAEKNSVIYAHVQPVLMT